MYKEPLSGSIIEVDRGIHSTTYTWKNGQRRIGNYFLAAFLSFWLCGWTVGGVVAIAILLGSKDMPLGARLFMIAWLGGWACGEFFVIRTLYEIFKRKIPSKIILSKNSFEFHTGTVQPHLTYNNHPWRYQNRIKPFERCRNKIYRFAVTEPVNLNLEWAGDRKRLTFDEGAERVEIGEFLTEPEKEWLFDLLKDSFGE